MIAELLHRAQVICGGIYEDYELFNADSPGVVLIQNDYERYTVAGMVSRYPEYIQASLSQGLNEVRIIDLDKLVAAILAE